MIVNSKFQKILFQVIRFKVSLLCSFQGMFQECHHLTKVLQHSLERAQCKQQASKAAFKNCNKVCSSSNRLVGNELKLIGSANNAELLCLLTKDVSRSLTQSKILFVMLESFSTVINNFCISASPLKKNNLICFGKQFVL